MKIRVRPPTAADRGDFVAAVGRSRELHQPWIEPPDTTDGYNAWLARLAARTPYQRHAASSRWPTGNWRGS